MTDFSVIIPTYKDWDRLSLCIDHLINQSMAADRFEIIIVNNELVHKPPLHFEKYKNVLMHHETKPGSYAARNSGAKLAKGIYLAFTDSDCLPTHRWLSQAKELIEEKQCDLIGGRVDVFKPENGSEWAYTYEKHTSFRQDKNVPLGKSVTANLFVKREVFEVLNGFDSDINSGGDWEFTERAVSKGYKMVYGDHVAVKHPARKSVAKILKKQKRFAAWGYLNVKNRHGHSGFRIIGSQLLRGTPAAFKSARISGSKREKLIVLLISLQSHFYKIFLKFLFLLKIVNPKKVRE